MDRHEKKVYAFVVVCILSLPLLIIIVAASAYFLPTLVCSIPIIALIYILFRRAFPKQYESKEMKKQAIQDSRARIIIVIAILCALPALLYWILLIVMYGMYFFQP